MTDTATPAMAKTPSVAKDNVTITVRITVRITVNISLISLVWATAPAK